MYAIEHIVYYPIFFSCFFLFIMFLLCLNIFFAASPTCRISLFTPFAYAFHFVCLLINIRCLPPVAIYYRIPAYLSTTFYNFLITFLLFRFFHPIKDVFFLPSSAPTLKTFIVADAVSINLAITLNVVWFYFVPYISFAITTKSFAVSYNHFFLFLHFIF